MDHGHLNESCGALDGVFIILGQPPRTIQPTKGSLHDPAFGLDNEPHLPFQGGHDFKNPGPADPSPRHYRPIGRIHSDDFGKLHLTTELGQGLFGAFGILDRSGRDDQRPQQAQRINDDMPLATVDFFFPAS